MFAVSIVFVINSTNLYWQKGKEVFVGAEIKIMREFYHPKMRDIIFPLIFCCSQVSDNAAVMDAHCSQLLPPATNHFLMPTAKK